MNNSDITNNNNKSQDMNEQIDWSDLIKNEPESAKNSRISFRNNNRSSMQQQQQVDQISQSLRNIQQPNQNNAQSIELQQVDQISQSLRSIQQPNQNNTQSIELQQGRDQSQHSIKQEQQVDQSSQSLRIIQQTGQNNTQNIEMQQENQDNQQNNEHGDDQNNVPVAQGGRRGRRLLKIAIGFVFGVVAIWGWYKNFYTIIF